MPSPSPVAWDAPPAAADGSSDVPDAPGSSRLDVGSVFARTLDTFLANWPTFVGLSLPTAITALAYYWIASSVTRTPALSLLYLLSIPIGIWITLAITIAADVARQGIRPAAATAAGSAVTPTFVAIFSGIVVVLAVSLVAVLPVLLLAVAPGEAAIAGAIAVLIAVLIVVYILLRWAFAPTAIALEGAGPITALSRSWQATEGNLWRLGVVIVAVGLLGLPWSLAGSFFALAGNLPVAIAVSVVGTLLFGSLPPIVTSLAYGDVTGRPRGSVTAPTAQPVPDAASAQFAGQVGSAGGAPIVAGPLTPRPVAAPPPPTPAPELSTARGLRWTYALGILVLGFALLVPAGALAVPRLGVLALGAIPPEDRGVVFFGTQRNPVNPCAPLGQTTTFSTTDPIYIGGYFSRTILPGQSASLHVYSAGQEVINAPIQAGARAVACYYEPEPLVGAPAGTYQIVIDDATGTLAEGIFTVQ
ncbi:MAG TPA: hypothetical protein VFV72_02280 [Candidatus Limnocylindrales bacterium]|nr:hypothetical protein [Candidatus Limnocylindrales bacterium]